MSHTTDYRTLKKPTSNKPIPTPRPESPETAKKRAVAETHRAEVRTAWQTIQKEMTPSQRELTKGSEPKAVESIGEVGGRSISGQTYHRPSGVAGVFARGLQAVGVAPPSGIRISREGRDPTLSKVRHEAAHEVLFKQNVPPGVQHDVMDLTRVGKGESRTFSFPLLTMATKAVTSVSKQTREDARQKLRKMSMRLTHAGK